MKEILNHGLLRHVTLRQLHVLEEIARTGRIQAAAKVLGVTPPAVTQQLALLEADAGTLLFERTRKGLRPTDAGMALLSAAIRIGKVLSDAADTCAEFKGLTRGRVSIGASSTAKYLVPRIIAAFAQQHPKLQFDLKVQSRDQITSEIEHLDLVITGVAPKTGGIEAVAIAPHPHVIVAAAGHPLGRRGPITLQDLAGELLLIREPGSATRDVMNGFFKKHKFQPNSSKEFGSNETIKQAVIAGLGIAFISAHTVAAEVGAGWLEILPVQGLPIVRHWYAVRALERQQNAASRAFWDFVIKDGAKYAPTAGPKARRATSG